MTENTLSSIQDTLSRLSITTNSPSVTGASTSAAAAAAAARNQDTITINCADLGKIISAKVQEILNPFKEFEAGDNSDNFPGGSIRDVDKIPDIVNSLREFNGKSGDFNSWRKSVDRIFEIFKSIEGSSKHYAILHTVRHKITGEADTALESYRTPLNWNKIKKVLMMHYADKRDIGTLEYQMSTLLQKNMAITEFYKKVYEHLSLLLDKVSCLDISEEAKGAMINSYRGKALDTFVRGLNGDLPRLLSIREPTSLPQALNLCQKLDNMHFRANYAHNHSRGNIHKPPPVMQQPHHFSRPVFYPELAHMPPHFKQYPPKPHFQNIPRPFAPHQFSQANQRPNFTGFNNRQNFPPKPPQPMEVDQSIRSKNANYQNFQRNYQFAQKRPHETSGGIPPKLQRNYFMNTNNDAQYDGQYYDQYENYNSCYPLDNIEQIQQNRFTNFSKDYQNDAQFYDRDNYYDPCYPLDNPEKVEDTNPVSNDGNEIDSVYFLD